MRLSSAARLNAAATVGLAVLVGLIFFIQSQIVRGVDLKVEKCVNLRLHLGDIRIVLYEADRNFDEKKLSSVMSGLDSLSSLVEEVDADFYGVKRSGVRDRYESARRTIDSMAGDVSRCRGGKKAECMGLLRIRAQKEITGITEACIKAEKEFKLLRKRNRFITTAAVSAAVGIAACAALALALFFSRRIQKAAAKLVAFSGEIAGGRAAPLSPRNDDEFLPVYDAMWSMALSLRRAYEDLAREEARLRRVGAELRETSEFLDKIVTHANAPIVVWGADFTITMFNRAFERLTLYRASEVIGRRLSMIFPEETAAASFEKIRRALDGEQWDSVEMQVRRKDGTSRIVLWNSANILDDDGSVAATVAQGQDITDRIETLQQLKASERRFRMLFSEIQVGVALHEIICDGEGRPIDYRYLEVNPAFERLVGRTASSVVGRTVREIMPRTEPLWIERFGEWRSADSRSISRSIRRNWDGITKSSRIRPKGGASRCCSAT